MHSSTMADFSQSNASESRWRAAGEIGLIFLLFFIHGGAAAPGTNEPHYLSKARHYWDAGWCAHDFFCGTADAHQVFYWTFGWLSQWLSLPQLAWTGRLLTWAGLAWAWRRLSWALVPAPFYAVLSAALFVTLNDRCQMAGEWVIGGVEAKGFAYVFVLLGLEALVLGRWRRVWLFLGAASAFHAIVGGWSVVAAGLAWVVSRDRPSASKLVWPLAGGLLLALPGLVSALALTHNVDAELANAANRVYVFERLSHHLDPQQFPPRLVLRHLLLLGLLVAMARFVPREGRFGRLRAFVAGAVGIAAIGFVVSLVTASNANLAASLLRYYWFRMSDVMVPLGVALIASAILRCWQTSRPTWHAIGLVVALLVSGTNLGETIYLRHANPRPPADANVANLPAWREMCAWIAAETPADAVFLTPRLAQTFRWYAGRAEVVSRKDIPQDAVGIVEWWRRMNRIHGCPSGARGPWRESLAELGSQRLQELGAEFHADYAIMPAYPRLTLERVGPESPSFAIYRLRKPPAPAANPK